MGVGFLLSRVICIGFFIYFVSFFLLDSSQQKTIFYLAVALPALFCMKSVKEMISHRAPSLSVLIFILYLVISSAWSGMGLETVAEALKYGLYLLCLMLAIRVVCDKVDMNLMVRFVVYLGGSVFSLYLVSILLENGSVADWIPRRSSLQSMSGWGEDNPISSAIILGLPILASWIIFPGKKTWVQLSLFMLMLLGLGLIFLTKSRGPLVALLLTLFLCSVYRRKMEDGVLIAALLLIASGVMFLSDISAVVMSRAAAPSYRLEIWCGALSLIADDWLLGQGFGHDVAIAYGRTVATHSHSSILEILRAGGVVGFLLFLFMIFTVIRNSVSRRVNIFFALWAIYGLLCLCTNGRLLLSRPAIEWFAFWLPLFFMLFCNRRSTAE